MKVLFKTHVVNVGKPGEVKEVKSGYAQNFLLPKGFAVELTDTELKKIQNNKQKDESHRRELLVDRHNIVKELNGKSLLFPVKTGANNKVYGGIGEKDIIDMVKKNFKIHLTKKHISLMDGHLKNLGKHDIYVKLGKDAMAKMNGELVVEKSVGLE